MTITLGEFRAWLDGFNEAIDGAPNYAQWKLIQEKLSLVVNDAAPITYEQYNLQLRPTWPRWYVTCNAEGASDASRLSLPLRTSHT